jgi:hypothetical protein
MRANDAALEKGVTHIDVLATWLPVDENSLRLGRSTEAALEVGATHAASGSSASRVHRLRSCLKEELLQQHGRGAKCTIQVSGFF